MGIIFNRNNIPTFNGTPIGDPANRTQAEINARVEDGKGNLCDYVNGRGKECKTIRESGNTRCRTHIWKP